MSMTPQTVTLSQAISWKRPGARFSLQGTHVDPYDTTFPDGRVEHADGLRWESADMPKPTQAEVDQWVAEYEAQGIAAVEEATRELDEPKALRSVVIWVAKRLNIPLATARAEIRALYVSLQ